MKKNILLLAAASTLFLSPSLALGAPASPDSASVASIRDKALQSDSLAYDIVEGLTTEIGPRQGGTEAEARARTWSVNKLKALGFDNVRIEEYQMPTWVRGEETAAVVAPFPQKLAIAALGNSGSTGEAGLEAEIVYFPTIDDLRAHSGWCIIDTRRRTSGADDCARQTCAVETKTDPKKCRDADVGQCSGRG